MVGVGIALLSGCTKTITVEVPRTVVISVPKPLINCPDINKFPNPDTMTNKQLADTITDLYKKHKVCKINMNKIQEYVDQAVKNQSPQK
jgi:hypothetical protein